jgi:hypothetical protein
MFKPSFISRPMVLLMAFIVLVTPFSHVNSAPPDPPFPPSNPVATQGYILDPEVQISTPLTPTDPDRYHPELAYNTVNSQYLVVWHNTYPSGHDREVYGQRIGTSGQKIGSPIVISSGTHDRIQPSVAYNATDNEYLVVFMYDENGDGLKYAIHCRRINAATGALLGSETTVVSVAGRTYWQPHVAWNSGWNEYMVVWTAMSTATQLSIEIGGYAIDSDLTYLFSYVFDNAGFPSNPDITWDPNNGHYVTVWQFLNASGKLGIKGDVRNIAGNLINSVNIYSSTTNNSINPKVTYSLWFLGYYYMVAFEYENASTDHDIYIAWISLDGASVISQAIITGSTNDVNPDIAGSWDTVEYMITFQRASTYGADILMHPISNVIPATDIEICNDIFSDCTTPSVFYGGLGYQNVYIVNLLTTLAPGSSKPETPPSIQHVFGRRFQTNTICLPIVFK